MTKDLRTLWWEENVDDVYRLIQKFCNITLIVNCLLRMLKVIFYPSKYLFDVLIPQTLIHILVNFFVKYAGRSIAWKVGIIVFVVEYFNIFLRYNSLTIFKDHSAILESISSAVTFLFEYSIITNKWTFNIVVIKHVYIWHVHRLLFYEADSEKEELSPYNGILLIIVLYNVAYHHIIKKSYEHYLYRKELESSKNRLNTVTEAYTDGILVISQDFNIKFFNHCILQLLDTTDSLLYTTLSNIKYIDGKKVANFSNSNSLIEDIYFLLENQEITDITLGITLIGDMNLEWRARKIEWENSAALFLIVRDATQIIDLELNIANNKMKTLLLRTVSHELKTPLNSIIYFTDDLLNSHGYLCEKLENKLEIISVSAKMMSSLINDLLDYSKILVGAFTIQKSYCNLKEIIENTCDLIRIQATKKNLAVITRIDPDIPSRIYTDPHRLSQIIINLLGNALKFTVKGKIEITCVNTSRKSIKCYIEDTGIGIEEDAIKLLFSGYQANYIPDISYQGYGLGLGISNLIAKQLCGKPIQVKSTMGKGSVFSFEIGVLDEIGHEHSVVVESNDTNLSHSVSSFPTLAYFRPKCREVLIVDDMEFNLEILGSVLKNYEINYDEAANGKIAVDKVVLHDNKGFPYKVIIMDCDMPEMNGWDASKKINQLFRDKNIKHLPCIIGYSAYSSDEDIRLSFESGMHSYLAKPCPPEKIISAILKFL
ncbi:unnamed protein product [Blepharisma stoltei]|uniref:Histidine kinase n=1 Tax=Blepharisma stoltei TaxID=1481888 RepID=A0AAU9K2W2_9CILI|nr:unnamed protein product [Blepharisma stoltei]